MIGIYGCASLDNITGLDLHVADIPVNLPRIIPVTLIMHFNSCGNLPFNLRNFMLVSIPLTDPAQSDE